MRCVCEGTAEGPGIAGRVARLEVVVGLHGVADHVVQALESLLVCLDVGGDLGLAVEVEGGLRHRLAHVLDTDGVAIEVAIIACVDSLRSKYVRKRMMWRASSSRVPRWGRARDVKQCKRGAQLLWDSRTWPFPAGWNHLWYFFSSVAVAEEARQITEVAARACKQ